MDTRTTDFNMATVSSSRTQMGPADWNSPLRIYLFDSMRTLSQLLRRMFEPHPDLEQLIHYYAAPNSYGPERLGLKLKHCEAAEEMQRKWCTDYPGWSGFTFASMTEILLKQVADIEGRGKCIWSKDHSLTVMKQDILIDSIRDPSFKVDVDGSNDFNNPTIIPEHFLHSLTPIVLIRHPALIWPSLYRMLSSDIMKHQVTDEDFAMMGSMRWTKIIFDYYRRRNTITSAGVELPIVLDAEDLSHHPRELMDKLCELIGINPTGVATEWKEGFDEKWKGMEIGEKFTSRLLKSRGVEGGERKAADINLDAEEAKWKEQFGLDAGGNDVARALRRFVDAEMPIYEYLKQHKLNS